MSAGSARLAGNANARAVPYPITRRKIGSVDVGSVPAYQASAEHEERLEHDAGGRDPAPIEAVGEGTGHEHEERGRRELGEPEQPEVELAAGEVEDLLAEDDGERRHRGGRATPPT